MYRTILALPMLLGGGLCAAPAYAQSGGQMSDYLLMRVCTASASPSDPAIAGMVPGDAGCAFTRQIAVGETPPYTLRDYATTTNITRAYSNPNLHNTCAGSFGPLLRANVPVTQTIAGVTTTRAVTFSQAGIYSECLAANDANNISVGLINTSVQTADPLTGYASIMGSSSPGGISLNDAYQATPPAGANVPATPVCKTATPYASARFSNSWLVGKSPVSATLPGPIDYAAVSLQLLTPTQFTLQQANGIKCSTPYASSFQIWRADWFMFYSGRQLPSMIAQHYTQANANNAGPGAAQQMERTYWTQNFGLSRWEVWTRSDSGINNTGDATRAKSLTLLAHGTCTQVNEIAGTPYNIITNPADNTTPVAMVVSNVNGIYQKVKVAADGSVQVWFMTLCADYTNIDRTTTGQTLPTVPSSYSMLWGP